MSYVDQQAPQNQPVPEEKELTEEELEEQFLEAQRALQFQHQPLPPHSYPLWVKIFAVAFIFAVIYSVRDIPRYLEAMQLEHSAQVAVGHNDYDSATRLYMLALKQVPASWAARVGGAEALWGNHDKRDDEYGMILLNDLELSEEQYARLTRVMPAEYQRYFERVKK